MATKIEKKSPIQINKFVFFIGVYLLQIGIKRYKTYFFAFKNNYRYNFYNPLIFTNTRFWKKKGATCFKLSCFIGIVSLYVIIKRFFPILFHSLTL